VVRVTADCPLIDPALIDQVVRLMDEQQADYASNFLERSYPRGLECEAMTMPALKTAWQMATEPNHRQQVSPYLQQRPDRFRLASLRCNRDLSHLWWRVDTAEDLAFVREVHRLMGDELTAAGWEQVLAQLEAHPELTKINSQVRRNGSAE
jgi:spore coat polysaccharide biosynthesis protein SpsF